MRDCISQMIMIGPNLIRVFELPGTLIKKLFILRDNQMYSITYQKIRATAVFLFSSMILAALPTVGNSAPANPGLYSLHGSACQPANLQQSINLGTRWDKLGVRNPNSEASGVSFFVVCPVIFGDDEVTDTGLIADSLAIGYWIGNIPAPVTVSCTARWFEFDNITPLTTVTASLVHDPADGTNTISDFFINSVVDPNIQDINGQDQHISVVCSLPAQTGITAIKFVSI